MLYNRQNYIYLRLIRSMIRQNSIENLVKTDIWSLKTLIKKNWYFMIKNHIRNITCALVLLCIIGFVLSINQIDRIDLQVNSIWRIRRNRVQLLRWMHGSSLFVCFVLMIELLRLQLASNHWSRSLKNNKFSLNHLFLQPFPYKYYKIISEQLTNNIILKHFKLKII